MDAGYGYDGRGPGSGLGIGPIVLLVGAVIVFGLFFFVTQVDMPPHVEDIGNTMPVPTLQGIPVIQEALPLPEGFVLQPPSLVFDNEGFTLDEYQKLPYVSFDDLAVMPGETFEEIARKVREAMEVEDFDMLLWERERVEQRDGMDQLFDENGPLDGVSAAWHGYYARWIMIHRPKWLPQSAEGVEPAVIYWTLYLKLRVNLPDQEVHPPGMAPWEWTGGRPNWLD